MVPQVASRRRAIAGLTLAAGLVTAAPAFAADAVLEPAGATSLTLEGGTAKALTGLGVRVTPVGPATTAKGAVAFPVTGGVVHDLGAARARVMHSGGLEFRAGSTRLRATDFDVRLGASPVLVATVGGKKMPLLRLSAAKAKVSFDKGRDLMVSGVTARLSAEGAKALNATFKVSAFTAGMVIGTTSTRATAYSTSVTIDPALAKTLTAAGIAPAPIAPAGANAAGQVVFPGSGGGLATTTFAGAAHHTGGLSLTKGATKVELTRFIIDTRVSPAILTGEVGGNRVPVFTVDLKGVTPTVTAGTVEVNEARLVLTPQAAQLLNTTFGLDNTLTGTTAFGTAVVRTAAR